MFAVMGVTGKVGRAVAERLLADRQQVRAIVRSREKGLAWQERGSDFAVADTADACALTKAFDGTEGAFVMLPPSYDPAPGFPETRALIAALRAALKTAKPRRAIVLSTVGGHVSRSNLLEQLHEMEESLRTVDIPITFLRAAWFMENAAWDVPSALQGNIQSFLQPLDRAIPMVATRDIGDTAARLLQQDWTGARFTQIEGPRPYSPNDLAHAFAIVLRRDVTATAVPRSTWHELFVNQGMKNPEPRMQMLDGFNEGWLSFEAGVPLEQGSTTLEEVVAGLISDGSPHPTSSATS